MSTQSYSKSQYRSAYTLPKNSFSPNKVSGLYLWTDFSSGLFQETTNPTTPAIAANDPIGTLIARTGQVLTAPSDSARPLYNGDSTITTDGVDDMLKASFTLAQPYTWYVAIKAVTLPAINSTLVDGNTINTGRIYAGSSGSTTNLFAGSNLLGPSGIVINTKYIIKGSFNGISSAISITTGGTVGTSGNAGASALDGISIGGNTAGQLGNITYREILLYSNIPSANDNTAILAYLKKKWGMP